MARTTKSGIRVFILSWFVAAGVQAATIACPANYIAVYPTDPNLNPFCIAKYEMKNAGGVAVSQAAGVPWVNIDRNEALAACEALGTNYTLISNSQWQAVANEIESTGANWSGGAQGLGTVNIGLGDQNPYQPVEASANDQNTCYGRSYSCSPSVWDIGRRTHVLQNGILWDFGGNVTEWVRDNMSVNYNIYDYAASPALRTDPQLQKGFATKFEYSGDLAALGLGEARLFLLAGALLRGGNYAHTAAVSGIYYSDSSGSPSLRSGALGFRCVYEPPVDRTPASTSCPAGFIPVEPTDPNVLPFCVAKYEMKNIGGKAVSQADLAPWNQITQTQAVSACAALGSGYDLIKNAEWQTIAREIEDNARNWQGLQVGVGSIAPGHADQSPFYALPASLDDRQGCFGTGEYCDSATWNLSKRTLALRYGTIWDFSGNVSEWVKDTNTRYFGWIGSAYDPSMPADAKALFGSMYSYSTQPYGLGALRLQYTGGAIARGGSFAVTVNDAGIYATDLTAGVDMAYAHIGFRCVFRPSEYVPPPPPTDDHGDDCDDDCDDDGKHKHEKKDKDKEAREERKEKKREAKEAKKEAREENKGNKRLCDREC